MNLAFSTKGWHDASFEDFTDIAHDLKFKGIELHNIHGDFFTKKDGPFDSHNAPATVRKINEMGISIPCINSICEFKTQEDAKKSSEEITECIKAANRLKVPFVRVKANNNANADIFFNTVKNAITTAEKANVTLLIETSGIFANTESLNDILYKFASDNVAALWDVTATFFNGNENPEQTIKNLGAFVKHVHIKDAKKVISLNNGSDFENKKSETENQEKSQSFETDKNDKPDKNDKNNNNIEYCLIGEGELPVNDIILALRSVNYDGFISLEWDPEWFKELNSMEIIFSHFINYMHSFKDTRTALPTLYGNNAKTGKFVWKKELLIDETFSKVLDRMVEEFPDQYAFKYTTLDYTRTYSEFRDDVNDCARAFAAMGVKQGSHIAVWATNIPEWYISFWAAAKLGAVLVTVNTAYKIHEAEYLLKQSDTHTLVMIDGFRDSNYKEIIEELVPELKEKAENRPLHSKRLPFLRNVITVGFKMKGAKTWEQAMELKSNVSLKTVLDMAEKVDKNDVCNMQYTSGTTGFPKGVMLTHYNVVNNGKCIGDRMDLSTADRMMIQVPMFHCFGMVLAMTAAMTHGATLLPLPYFSPKPALACINSEHITAFHGVPTMFIALLEHPDFKNTDFSYMRTGIMAGSPCPISVMKDVVNKMNMKEITIVYGQTESSPGCTMSKTTDPLEVRVGTVGGPLPEIECKIVNPETGEECEDLVTGEFVARGYNIMKGYYKMPKATAEAIDKDGWLHTGDLACRTPEGNFRITGRLKDMIIRGGENIYPKEIEEFIYTHKSVKDVQVIGVPDKQYGEEIMACIILKEGEKVTVEEMKEYIQSHMARHKVPKYIDFVDSFPMNVAGKILKYKMREDAVKKFNLESDANIPTA